MKTLVRSFAILSLVLLRSQAVGAEREFLDIKLGTGAIQSAGLDLADVVLTGLDNLLNQYPLETQLTVPRFNQNCGFLNPLISYFNLGISGFNLAQFTEDNVFLTSSSDGENSGSMMLLIEDLTYSIDNIMGGIQTKNFWAGNCQKVNICAFAPVANLKIGRIEWGFSTGVASDQRTLSFESRFLPKVKDISLTFDSNFSGLCDTGLDVIEYVLNLSVEELISDLVENIGEAIEDLMQDVTGYFPNLRAQYTIPEPLISFPLLLSPGRDFSFSLFVKTITGDPNYLGTRLAGSMMSRLTQPDWRIGNSHSPRIDDRPMPQDVSDSQLHLLGELAQINFMFGSAGLNGIVQSLWYLMWSILATDSRGASSEYCVAGDNDPCLYPAVSRSIEDETAIMALSTAFKSGLYEAFDLDAVISPPNMEFIDNGIQGSTKAELVLVGLGSAAAAAAAADNSTGPTALSLTNLASLKSGLSFKATLPKFDRETGKISGMSFDLDIDRPEVESFRDGITAPGAFILQFVLDAVHNVLHDLLDTFLYELNTGIEEFFNEIVFQPPEPITLAPNLALRVGFSDESTIFWQAGTDEMQGVAGLALGVSMKVAPPTP